MLVEIIKSQPGSPDGNTVIDYQAGQTYQMPDDLAAIYLREGWGRSAEKAVEAAPENKAVTKAPAKKGKAPRV